MKLLALLGAMMLMMPAHVGVLGHTGENLIQYVTGKRKKR